MNKNLFLIALALLMSVSAVFAQKRAVSGAPTGYNTAAGLRVDFGDGSSGVGPNIKHFFTPNGAVDASLLFWDGGVSIEAQYQYNASIRNANGLAWYVGVGPSFGFPEGEDSKTLISIVPVIGLEYTIPGAPLNMGLDWRPHFTVSPSTHTTAGRFGLSVRYTF